MWSLKALTVLFLVNCVFASPYFKDCPTEYEACGKAQLKNFFTEFSAGDSAKGMKPTDPMVLDEIEVLQPALDLKFHYKQFRVTGFNDVVVTGFKKLDGDGSRIIYVNLKFDFIAEGPLEVEFIKKNKVFSGSVKYEGGVTSEITYPVTYETKNGESHPALGEVTITCTPVLAKSTISDDLKEKLGNDADAVAITGEYQKLNASHQAKVVRQTATAVLEVVFENIRALLRSEA